MTPTETELYWDPFDVGIDANPYPVWQRLRDEAPVYRNEQYDFWALSRFADVEAAHRRSLLYSSAHGTVLELMSPEPLRIAQVIFMDPPEHTRLRALVSRAFTPRRVSALEERIREICAELFDEQAGNDTFDYVQAFAARLPSMVITDLLGVPASDQEMVRGTIDRMFHIEEGVGMINDFSFAARIELHEYLMAALEEREASPRDDMLTDLRGAEVTEEDGSVRRLSLRESAEFANLHISAGTETVARLLGFASVVLDEHPDQRAELATDPTLIPRAIEELLRYEAPSPVQGRWLTEEVELHGQVIPAQSKILLLTGSAGRDDRKYPDADRFDIHRRFDHHVAFGYGVHFCLGAALARLEGRIGLEETLARFPEWSVDREGARRLHTSTVRGWINVPVTVPR